MALPDSSPRVVSLSTEHGPSLVDLAGVVVLLAGWLPVLALVVTGFRVLRGTAVRTAGVLAAAGVVGLVVTVRGDLGGWWVAAVAALLAAQGLVLRGLWQRG